MIVNPGLHDNVGIEGGDKSVTISYLRMMFLLLFLAVFLVAAFFFLRQPSLPAIKSLEDWSFTLHPVPRYAEMSQEEWDTAWHHTSDVDVSRYCKAVVDVHYEIYQKNNPRFRPFADSARAQQLFLHNAALRSSDDAMVCFPATLFSRVFEYGNGRCNFNIHRDEGDPIVRADLNMIIHLVEIRHPMMMQNLLFKSTLTRSNELLLDTQHYLLEQTRDQDLFDPSPNYSPD